VWDNYTDHPGGLLFPLTGLAGLLALYYFHTRRKDGAAFCSSATFIAGMLGATAFGLFPNLLPASTEPAHSLTIYNAAAQEYGLGVGVIWFTIGMILTLGYLGYVVWMQRGTVDTPPEGSGY